MLNNQVGNSRRQERQRQAAGRERPKVAQRPEASPDPSEQLAPIWRRVLGQVIDQIVVLSPVVAIALVIGVRTVDI